MPVSIAAQVNVVRVSGQQIKVTIRDGVDEAQVTKAVVTAGVMKLVSIAAQGPQGIQGESGGAAQSYVYGETISALKAVVIIDGEAFIADNTNPNHKGRVAGITETAAVIGNSGNVRLAGQMQDDSWNWSNAMLFFDDNGTLTETPQNSGFLQAIARVESPDTIFVNSQTIYGRI